jgi:hypothetical protein
MYNKNVMLHKEVGFDGYIKSSTSRLFFYIAIWYIHTDGGMVEWWNGGMARAQGYFYGKIRK